MAIRALSAAYTPSIVFLGFSVYELSSSAFFMIANPSRWNTTLFRLAIASWVFTFMQTVSELMMLDVTISPFDASPRYVPVLSMLNFSLGTVSFIVSTVLMLYRVRALHPGKSSVFWSLVAFAALAVLVDLPATVSNMMLQVKVIKGGSPAVLSFNDSSFLFSMARALEGWFSATAGIAFLWSISNSLNANLNSAAGIINELVFKHQGLHFITFIIVNFIYFGFAAHGSFFGSNYINYTGFFLPPWIHALAINAFVRTGYVSIYGINDDYSSSGFTYDASKFDYDEKAYIDSYDYNSKTNSQIGASMLNRTSTVKASRPRTELQSVVSGMDQPGQSQ